MLQQLVAPQQKSNRKLYLSLARNPAEIAEAQALRYQVFAEEMGAQVSGVGGLDVDGFDQFCDHLLVRETQTHQVVGTYRILSPSQANEAGGYYSAGEFDLSRITHLFASTVEVGRACVHRDFRQGSTIALLWAGLAKYMQMHQYQYMIGCACIPMHDGGHAASSLYQKLKLDYMAPPEFHVFPHTPLPLSALRDDMQVACPPLLRGYLRLGAKICGTPAWDGYFNTADILVMLSMSDINARYASHFLK